MPIRANDSHELVYPELSFKIIGLAMEVHNELGNIFQEKHYQRLFEGKLKNLDWVYEREKKVIPRTKDGCDIGEFSIDFIIDKKILLEFKRVNCIKYDDVKQVLRYLNATGLKLGIIINFKNRQLEYKRVINPQVDISS